MSKQIKKRVQGAKERVDRIYQLLYTRRTQADVHEFLSTTKYCSNVLEEFVKSKDKLRPALPEDGALLEKFTKEYEELLNQVIKTQRFLRFFTSNRVRRTVDNLNIKLYKEIYSLACGLEQKKGADKQKKKQTEFEKTLLLVFSDVEARSFWEKKFSTRLYIPWDELQQALSETLASFTSAAVPNMRYILDNSDTGYVGLHKFADFLAGFGPFADCINKVIEITRQPWFHGFLSSTEAERLLEKQPNGTFLIRFSKSKPGAFAIAYVDLQNRGAITHTLITITQDRNFSIEETTQTSGKERMFPSLIKVTEFYNYILKSPLITELSSQPFFHGDLTAEEAQELLLNKPEGTFLLRFSSRKGFLVASYTAKKVVHALIEVLPMSFRFENQSAIFRTLRDLVNGSTTLLKFPLTSVAFETEAILIHEPNSHNINYLHFEQANGSLGSSNGSINLPSSPRSTSYQTIQSNYANAPSPNTEPRYATPISVAENEPRYATPISVAENEPRYATPISVAENEPRYGTAISVAATEPRYGTPLSVEPEYSASPFLNKGKNSSTLVSSLRLSSSQLPTGSPQDMQAYANPHTGKQTSTTVSSPNQSYANSPTRSSLSGGTEGNYSFIPNPHNVSSSSSGSSPRFFPHIAHASQNEPVSNYGFIPNPNSAVAHGSSSPSPRPTPNPPPKPPTEPKYGNILSVRNSASSSALGNGYAELKIVAHASSHPNELNSSYGEIPRPK